MTGDDWVAVGRVRKPFGLRGEVSVEIWGETDERFQPGAVLHLRDSGGRRRRLVVSRLRVMTNKAVVAFEGIAAPEAVEDWRHALLEVPAGELPALEPDRYYYFQLAGLDVVDAAGEPVGRVADVVEAPGQTLLVVEDRKGRERIVPFVGELVAEVDLDAGRLRLAAVEGLLDL
ncbi:MAG: 16S rRNA processing protein RimM [Candidatus Eisenbacteria bacterium]|nr:16S rRNA processing protein RimM [Candidatus Eisenbacteria bacterium]